MSTLPPVATYRLQLTPSFTLYDAARIVPYLRDLGATHLYLSPLLEARAGSTHGYDVTDPWAIRAEFGGEPGLDALTVAARTAGLGLLLDIVPNHMAASIENRWWRDLLEFGSDSPHVRVFDLSWRSDPDQQRILLPVLGDELDAVLQRGDIRIGLDAGGFLLTAGDNAFPVTPATYGILLDGLGMIGHDPPAGFDPEPFRALDPVALLDDTPDPFRRERAAAARDAFLREIANPGADEPLKRAIEAWNARDAVERRSALEELIERQAYELAFWRRSLREITYRRFFDVTELVGIHVHDPAVLAATHRRVLTLVAGRVVDGLRIDHVDGLRDPHDYLERLTHAGGEAAPYVLVEKILAPDETLPASWRTDGTTGYEFITTLDGWFVEPRGWDRVREAYIRFTGRDEPFSEIAYRAQRQVIDDLFGGELRSLTRWLLAIARATNAPFAAEIDRLARTLAGMSAALDVYRTYIRSMEITDADRVRIERAAEEAARREPDLAPDLIPWLRDVLLLRVPDAARADALEFVMRWQQFTGPVMAKGFEDTALYNDYTLASANDVGGHPGEPAVSTDRLYRFLVERGQRTPLALNAASTHDTKRGEDARARIAVLSEVPEEWTAFLNERAADPGLEEGAAPSPVDRVLLFQTLVATWPAGDPDDAYIERISAYMTKAAREAKARTSWRDPDPDYENALADAVRSACEAGSPIRAAITRLAQRVAFPAALASLSRTIVRLTAPGIPDTYQGAELWHDALVDPDNRRTVDYERRRSALAQMHDVLGSPQPVTVRELIDAWNDGRIKQYLIARTLRRRAERRALFESGACIRLAVEGDVADHVFSFARRKDDGWSITVCTRWLARFVTGNQWSGAPWRRTVIRLPDGAPAEWNDALSGATLHAPNRQLDLGQVLACLPVALLEPFSV